MLNHFAMRSINWKRGTVIREEKWSKQKTCFREQPHPNSAGKAIFLFVLVNLRNHEFFLRQWMYSFSFSSIFISTLFCCSEAHLFWPFSGNKFNFNKYNRGTIDSLGTKYDYGSVMHYGSRAFSKNGRPTIVAKRSGVWCNHYLWWRNEAPQKLVIDN